MEPIPHITGRPGAYRCAFRWLPGVAGTGTTPLTAYMLWREAYFATPLEKILQVKARERITQGAVK